MMAWAYGRLEIANAPDGRTLAPMADCHTRNDFNLFSGGPEWIKSDQWDIEALMPEGSYTEDQLRSGRAPRLQRMLQALLKDRFNLVLRAETKETQVYLLTVGDNGPKFNGRRSASPMKTYDANGNLVDADVTRIRNSWRIQLAGRLNGKPVGTLDVLNTPLATLAPGLSGLVGRLILDRTGIIEDVTFHIAWPRDIDRPAGNGTLRPGGPALSKAFEEIGLRLQDAKAPIESWVIEHAEKPSEN
jgi:uncharacterized protein (TIGR03435 family)